MTFFIVTFILMMNFVWRYIDDLVGKGLDASVIAELIMYATINMVPMGLPLAILLATIMTMGNLGENYELLAMKSAGMSLPRIMRPLLVVVSMMAVGSFFIVNNLVPYANQKMFDLMYNIKEQNDALEFQDGIFFNGIDNLNIRVEHQDPETGLLHNVLIYDNRAINGNMTTTLAESGFIRMSEDKQYLLVTLFNGETYETTRNNQWYTNSTLRRHKFERQDGKLILSSFKMPKKEDQQQQLFSNASQTKNIDELQHSIDSLTRTVDNLTTSSYSPLLREHIFAKDPDAILRVDSIAIDRSGKIYAHNFIDSIPSLDARQQDKVWNMALQSARNSRNVFSFDETTSKEALNQLYRSKNEWHRKLALPVSIVIFFLIGAPLGAIIRRGGLGMPTVVSVLFFVVYYVISLSGEKLAKEGTWSSLLGMWISSIVLAPIALFLTRKASNDSVLFDMDWYIGRIKRFRRRLIGLLPTRWQEKIAERDARREAKRAAKAERKRQKRLKKAQS